MLVPLMAALRWLRTSCHLQHQCNWQWQAFHPSLAGCAGHAGSLVGRGHCLEDDGIPSCCGAGGGGRRVPDPRDGAQLSSATHPFCEFPATPHDGKEEGSALHWLKRACGNTALKGFLEAPGAPRSAQSTGSEPGCRVQIPAPPPALCVTVGKGLDPSVSQFPRS